MTLEWLPAVTAPAAAVVGAAAGYALSRSRLTIVVERVQVTASRIATRDGVVSSVALQESVLNFPDGVSRLGKDVVPERTYVTYLELVQLEVAASRERAETGARIAEECRRLVAGRDIPAAVERYKYSQKLLWAVAEGRAARGDWTSPVDMLAVTSSTIGGEAGNLFVTDTGDYLVDLPGPISLYFDWSNRKNVASKARSRSLAEYVASGFAAQSGDVLLQFFTEVREEVREQVRKADGLLADLRSQLRDFDRVQVEVVVSNTGRSGCSIAAQGELLVDLAGYVAGRIQSGTSGGSPTSGPVQLSAKLFRASEVPGLEEAARDATNVDLSRDEVEPILIQAGESLRLIALSDLRIDESPSGRDLRAAYAGAERTFRLGMRRFISPGRWRFGRGANTGSTLLLSRPVLFREFTIN